jgi:SAM-dependent methyltransferase
MLEALGRKFARFTTNQVVRWPRAWPLFRWVTRRQFDRIAPVWDEMRSTEAFAPLEAALDSLDTAPSRVLDLGTGTGRAAFLLARRYPEAEVVGVDLAPAMLAEARSLTPAELASRVRFEESPKRRSTCRRRSFGRSFQGEVSRSLRILPRATAPRSWRAKPQRRRLFGKRTFATRGHRSGRPFFAR